MTSFAFIPDGVPLVLASGAGAETRRTLGTAVFSGMLGVTVLGLLPKAVFYYAIERLPLLRATPTKTNAPSCAPQVPLAPPPAWPTRLLETSNSH